MLRTLALRLDNPLLPLLLSALAYALFIALLLARHNDDASQFVVAGDTFANLTEVPPNLHVLTGSAGYDGQFYYRLALDPFTAKQTDFGITLDIPAYRHSRIFYPLLTWIVSLGRSGSVPAVMLFLNYLALCAIGGMAGVYAQHVGRHAAWGLLIVLLPCYFFTVARDLTETLALAFLLASLVLAARKHFVLATVTIVAGVLTRETTLLWVGAVLLVWLGSKLTRKPIDLHPFYFVVPFVTYGVWQVLLALHWGSSALAAGSTQFGIPLGGVVPFLIQTLAAEGHLARVWTVEVFFSAAFSIAVLLVVRSSRAALELKLAWVLYGAAALCWTRFVWVEDWAFMRLLSEFYLFGALVLVASPSRIKHIFLAGSFALWLYLFRDFVTMR